MCETGPGVFNPSPVTSSTTRDCARPAGGDRGLQCSERDAGRGLAEDAGRGREVRHVGADLVLGDGVDRSAGGRAPSRRRSRRRPDSRSRASARCCPAGPARRAGRLGKQSPRARSLRPGRRRAPGCGRRRGRALQLAEPLPDLVEERARGDRDRDGVRSLPAELLRDLVGQGLRALGVVGAQVDVDESPRQLERQLDREPRAVVVRAVDGVDPRAVDRGCGELLGLEVARDEDCRLEAFGGGPGGDRSGEIPRRGAGERVESELLRLPRRDGDDAILERMRRVRGVELEPELADAELRQRGAEPARAASCPERGVHPPAPRPGADRRSARSTADRPRSRRG